MDPEPHAPQAHRPSPTCHPFLGDAITLIFGTENCTVPAVM